MRRMPGIKYQSPKFCILEALSNGNGLSVEDLKEKASALRREYGYSSYSRPDEDAVQHFVESRLAPMKEAQLLVSNRNTWYITADGLAELRAIKEDFNRTNIGKATPRRIIGEGIYQGEELRRLSDRPGAYDAFSKPSKLLSRTNV